MSSWPVPRPGFVVRYAYLWDREARAGREEGVKDRPCAVILAHAGEDGRTRVYASSRSPTRGRPTRPSSCPGP